MLRFIRWAATGLLILLVLAWGTVWMAARDPGGAAGRAVQTAVAWFGGGTGGASGPGLPPGLSIGGPFQLTGQDGRTVTSQDFRGRFMLVYFGYTYCPDICPTELQAVAAALGKLGPDADRVVPIFITVDPQRDNVAVLSEYVKLFDQRMVGLTGTAQQIADVAREYRVYYAKATPKGGGDYLMDHSSFIYLMGPDGRLRALIRPGTSPEDIAATVEAQLRQGGAQG